jgi:cell division protein ZipA
MVLLAAVFLLCIARWFKNKKSVDPKSNKKDPYSLSEKGATRHSRSRRFDLDPLRTGELSLQLNDPVDALTSTSSLSKPISMEVEPPPSDLIVIHAIAEKGNPYQGYNLLQALLASNLRFGDQKIFHRYKTGENNSNYPLYSVATLNKPGTFDLAKMGGFSCDGLVFFSQLEGLTDSVRAFELMLDAAEKLVQTLGGHLADEARAVLTTNTIANMRKQASYYACLNAESVMDESACQ